MQIKSKYLHATIIVLIPLLLGTFTYITNLILIPAQAILNFHYWPYYIVNYILTRLIFFLPAVWIYPLIFKEDSKRNKIYGIIYAVSFALFYSICVFTNDARMSLEISDDIMMPITYTLTAIIIYYTYEFLGENRKGSNQPR